VSGSLRGYLGRLRPPWPDVALALAFTVAALLAAWYRHRSGSDGVPAPDDLFLPRADRIRPDKPIITGEPTGPEWSSVAATLPMTAALAWRRRLPLAVLVVQFVGVFTVDDIGWVAFLAVLVGAYSLARHGRSPLLSLGTLMAAAALVALSFPNSAPDLPGWLVPFAILLPIGLSGAAIRSARARADALAERAALLEREQESATRAAVVDERARIARELHDVVSHHVSVMTIQAGAAGRVLGDRPDLAREAMGAVEASGREAMGELRHLLGLLAAEPGARPAAEAPAGAGPPAVGTAPAVRAAPPPLRPQPGLGQLDALVAAVRAAGQPITVRTRPLDLPGGVDLAAYRVIQEALTNALRYAPGARTEVVVDRDGESLVIEVTDDGTGAAPAGGATGGGTGLLGLAERLGLYHGTLEAGRHAGGGFRLRARIPLEDT
jgi:signal transduction histidine kinase